VLRKAQTGESLCEGNRKQPLFSVETDGSKGENASQELTEGKSDFALVFSHILQGHIYRQLRAARSLPGGRLH